MAGYIQYIVDHAVPKIQFLEYKKWCGVDEYFESPELEMRKMGEKEGYPEISVIFRTILGRFGMIVVQIWSFNKRIEN